LKYNVISIPALIVGVSVGAFAQGAATTKVGIIHIQNAIISTKDGQKAAKDLQDKFAPTRLPVLAPRWLLGRTLSRLQFDN
jgi:Skp family chaperone for outer membrane proteins